MKLITILLISSIMFSSTYARNNSATMSLTKYRSRFQWPLSLHKSDQTDSMNGATLQLDQPAIKCGIGAIAQFQIVFLVNRKFLFHTQCLMPFKCNRMCPRAIKRLDRRFCSNHKTPFMRMGVFNRRAHETNYLTKHKIRCPRGKVLNYFEFNSHTTYRYVWYTYRCCPAITRNCRSYRTPLKTFGDNGTKPLEKHIVKAPHIHKQAITGFRLLVNQQRRSFQYLVHYCDVTGR